MWYKNKKTGVEWEITNASHQRLLEKDSDYELIENTEKKAVEETKPLKKA